MSDDLDAEIARTEAELLAVQGQMDALARQAELLRVRVEAFKLAAKLRPPRQEASRAKPDATSSRGRQPGAISRTWRNILRAAAAKHPDGAGELAFADLARAEGLPNIRPKDVRSRMEDYERHGYVQPALDGWRVTPYAVAKFGSETVEDGADSTEDEAEMEAADAA